MKPKVLVVIGLSLMFTTVNFASRRSTIQTAVAASKRISNGQIIQVLGNVQLKRAYGSVIRPTTGTLIYPGDELQTANKAQAFVQCTDLTTWSVQASESRLNSCASETQETEDENCTPGLAGCPDRGDEIARNNPSIPYIISPRRTALLDDKPTLRWNAVPGATSYTVSVTGNDGEVWQTQVSGTEVTYSGESPLNQGVYYLLTVETDNDRFSVEEDVPGLGFTILDDNKQEQVKAAVNQLLANETLDEEAKALSITYVYMKQGLRTKAIETLEALINKGHQTVAVYHRLGKLYQQVGLSRQAEENYLKAAELAATEDSDEQAVVAEDLGEMYAVLGERDNAIELLKRALIRYEALGDSQRVSELKNQLTKLANTNES
jgi:hypothetical protein